MAVEIKMPQLSDTMHSGKILSWKKKEGDKISRGDILAEVETEKANLEIESFHQGVLLKILAPAQTQAGVGDVIAIIGQPGEQVDSKPVPSIASNPPATSAAATPTLQASAPASPVPELSPATSPTNQMAASNAGRLKVSPLAKKIAAERQVDLSLVQGTGPEGRIVRKDVELQVAGGSSVSNRSLTATQQPTRTLNASNPGSGSTREMSKMRTLIAARMQESMRDAPHFYVTTKVNMGEAKRLQTALKQRPEFSQLSLNHLIIKACAYALTRERRVNNAMRNGAIFEPAQINIGIITSVEDGLLIPVVRDADQLSLKDVAFEAKAAIDRAKAGRPTSADLSGGTFSISNMGMFDVENFTAIINPGQGAVLAVSSTITEPVVMKGQIVVGETMKVTLSVDHRIIDGVMGATFLKFFKEALEMPALLML